MAEKVNLNPPKIGGLGTVNEHIFDSTISTGDDGKETEPETSDTTENDEGKPHASHLPPENLEDVANDLGEHHTPEAIETDGEEESVETEDDDKSDRTVVAPEECHNEEPHDEDDQ